MEYDHSDGEYINDVRVAFAKPGRDFHDYPKMVMADDDRLVVVYTNSPETLHVTKAATPHTSSGEWTDKLINTDNPTYPCLIKSSNGTLYVFYRSVGNSTDYRSLHYVKSTSHGDTWSAPMQAIDTGGLAVNQDPMNLNEIYNDCPRHELATSSSPERFVMGWTMSGGGPGAILHNNYHKDAHFAYFYPGNDTFGAVDGTNLGSTIDYDELNATLMFDSGPLDSDNKRIVDYYFAPSTLDPGGYPLMVFNFNKTLIAARWSGVNWEHSVVAQDAAYNLFDLEKTGPNRYRLFQAQGDVFVITSNDGGVTWQREHRIVANDGGSVSKVIRIHDAHPDIALLAHENNWTLFHSDAPKDLNYKGTFNVWTMRQVTINPIKNPYYVPSLMTPEEESLLLMQDVEPDDDIKTNVTLQKTV